MVAGVIPSEVITWHERKKGLCIAEDLMVQEEDKVKKNGMGYADDDADEEWNRTESEVYTRQ